METDCMAAVESMESADDTVPSEALENVTDMSALPTATPSEEENVLQLTLTGNTVEKFARILQEKGLQTAEEAIQYFYNLHSNKSDLSVNEATVQVKKRPGRPKGSKSKNVIKEENEDDNVVNQRSNDEADEADTNEQGTVLIDGVRKSTRRRRNPYVSTEYIPTPKLGDQDSDASNDDEWGDDLNDNLGSLDEGDSTLDMEDHGSESSSLVAITSHLGGNSSGSSKPSTVHVLVTTAPPEQAIMVKRHKKLKGSSRKPLSSGSRHKKLGRPRKRAKEAVLTENEETTKNCSKCNEHFETLTALRSHKMAAHGRPGHPYFCEYCDYTAMFDCDMKRHQLVHSKTKKYQCEVCDFGTNWERNINLHMENVHKDREPWKCDRCDMKIYNHGKVKQHQLSHNPNAHKCPECELLFETIAKRDWHVNNMHNSSKTYECQHCMYAGNSLINLKLHMKNKHGIEERQREKQLRRKKRVMCEICNKRLINDEQKAVHMQIHEPENRDKEKPYYCTVCDARCADLNQMVRHRGIHSEEKPFQCRHCNYRTRWKKDLKTHEMIHTGVKSVHCPHCNYSCYTQQRLRAHMIKHDESRRYECPLCNMSFKSRQALRMHTMYHTGEASYSCDRCDFRTVTELRLKKHKLRHTDERNYSCNLCGKKFKQPHHVTQHRDIVHLGKPSYRERKRIALQQSAAEALGSLNSEVNLGQTLVVNDDGTTTLVDIAVNDPVRQDEPTEYVMVETPAGLQYVAVVIPDGATQTSATSTAGFTTESSHVTTDPTTLEDAQILLAQATNEQGQPLGVYYSPTVTTVGSENNQSVENLVALQHQ